MDGFQIRSIAQSMGCAIPAPLYDIVAAFMATSDDEGKRAALEALETMDSVHENASWLFVAIVVDLT